MTANDPVLEIPDSAYQSKPWFRTRDEADAAVAEIKDWIRSKQPPYLWRGHTHSKPTAGTAIAYVGEFDVPDATKANGRLCPCPCCSPTTPKFARNGRIAWFEGEGVIRLLGPGCYASLDKYGHTQAEAEFQEKKARESAMAALAGGHERFQAVLNAVETNAASAESIEKLRAEIKLALRAARYDLDRYARARLPLEERLREVDRNGNTKIKIITREYAPSLVGLEFYSNSEIRIFSDLTAAINELKEAWGYLKAIDIKTTPTPALRVLADKFNAAHKKAADASEKLARYRAGIDVVTISTIRTWAKQTGSPFPAGIEFRRQGALISIGSGWRRREIRVPPELYDTTREVPPL